MYPIHKHYIYFKENTNSMYVIISRVKFQVFIAILPVVIIIVECPQ